MTGLKTVRQEVKCQGFRNHDDDQRSRLKYVTDRQTDRQIHVRQAAVLPELAGSSMKRSVQGCKHNYLLITYIFFFYVTDW